MNRIPFSQVLKNAQVDLRREYDRLYTMFFTYKISEELPISLREYCAANFINLPFSGTCISLDDFDNVYNRHFEKVPQEVDDDYLISFCEYSYNLAIYNQGGNLFQYGMIGACEFAQIYIQQILKVVDTIGYMPNTLDGVTDFVPKDQAAISVAEIVAPDLSYKVIEYNHHSMKGDLEHKRNVLLALSDKLEPQRKTLEQIDKCLTSDIFYLFNSLNIRHNNVDPTGTKYKCFVATMNDDELESWYDDTYQMCLLAFLLIDNVERKQRIVKLKENNKN